MVLIIENHPADSRVRFATVFQTLPSRMGTGGGNVPLVLEIDDEDVSIRPGNEQQHEEQ